MWYGFLLSFAGPVSLISVFYALVVLRLRRIAANRISQSHKSGALTKSHARVTALVLTVIAVYVCCWLPYWVFQVNTHLLMPTFSGKYPVDDVRVGRGIRYLTPFFWGGAQNCSPSRTPITQAKPLAIAYT